MRPPRVSVTAEVSVSDREPDDGVVWLHAVVAPGAPVRREPYELEEARRQALYDARWAIAEAAREQGLVPFRYPLGTSRGFPYYFDGEHAALRFVKAPAADRRFLYEEITRRET